MTTLPAIFLSTSSTSIGLKPDFLSNGISLLAVKVLKDCVHCSSSEQNLLMKFAKLCKGHLMNFQIA